jgi:ubiquinone/menaquinone biosynthesis C-methylase UbiE
MSTESAEGAPSGRQHDPTAAAARYDSMASRYDRWYDSPVNSRIDEIETLSLTLVLPRARDGGCLLDIGSGTGHWFPLYASKGYRVAGIDISSAMLDVARKKFGGRCDLIRGDALELPIRDMSFDVVCAMATLHLVPQPSDVVLEMYRCLKPGGRLIIGALNALSYLGVTRMLLQGEAFRGTRFLTVRRLRGWLRRFGVPHIETCAFFPPSRLLLPIAGWIEAIGSRLLPTVGQFIVAYVDKPGDLGEPS